MKWDVLALASLAYELLTLDVASVPRNEQIKFRLEGVVQGGHFSADFHAGSRITADFQRRITDHSQWKKKKSADKLQ